MRKNLVCGLLLLSLSLLGWTLPEDSLYNLTSQWNDQAGHPVRLQQLGGKVQVLAMVYTNCQSVCPAIITAMKTTEARLSAAERAQVGFVLVSIDPAVDTSE